VSCRSVHEDRLREPSEKWRDGRHQPDLMPGFLIYGVLSSILAQLLLIALAVVMLRRADLGRAPGPTRALRQ